MNLALANGEHIVKTWNYGVNKGLFLVKGTYSLTVTNKKIISVYEGKKETSREDYELQNVHGVNVSYKYKRRFIFFKRGQLSLSFFTPVYDDVTIVGLSAIGSKKGFFARLFGKRTKVKVDVNVAKDIVENISALIMNTTEAGV